MSQGKDTAHGTQEVDGIEPIHLISLVPVPPVAPAVGTLLFGELASVCARGMQHDRAVQPWNAGRGHQRAHHGHAGSLWSSEQAERGRMEEEIMRI